MKTKNIKNQGYIAFSSLLVISAVVLAVSVSVALQGVTESQASLTYKKGQESMMAANGCIEEALIRLRDSVNYTGGSLGLGNSNCVIALTGTGADRTIVVTSTITDPPDYVKHLEATVKRAGNSVNVISWLETN
jgi:hypothetical protein